MTEINKKVGLNIRKYREKKGWTQEQFAFEANLHRAYIGQYVSAKVKIALESIKNNPNEKWGY